MNIHYRQSSLPNLPAGLRRVEASGPWVLHNETGYEAPRSIRPRLRGSFHAMRIETGIASFADLQEQVFRVHVIKAPEPTVIKDLQLLREEEQNSEEPITQHAYSTASDLLEYVLSVFGTELPRTVIVPDGDGGVRIEWTRGDRIVRVLTPPGVDEPSSIYQRTGRQSDIVPFSKSSVVHALRTLIEIV